MNRPISAFRAAGALTIVMAMAAVTGCAGGAGGQGGESDGERTIDITVHPSLVAQFTEYAEAFEESHEGYTVNVAESPVDRAQYIQQLVSQNLSNDLPDIMINFDGVDAQFAADGLTMDMTPWLDEGKGGLSLDGFVPAFVDIYTNEGAVTGLPVSADSGLLFYNIDLFEKYGVALPTEGWTYDDMYAAGREISEKSGGEVYGLRPPLVDGSQAFTYAPVLAAEGTQMFDSQKNEFTFADEAGIRAWTLMLEPYVEGWGEPYSADIMTKETFASGQAAMQVTARPAVATLRSSMEGVNWNVAPVPELDGKSTTGGGAYALSITEKSEDKEGAWEFLSWFFATDGGMVLAQANGVVPTTQDGLTNGAWKDDANPVPADLVAATEYAVENAVLATPIPASVAAEVTPALQKAVQEVLLNGTSVEDAFGAAQDQLNALVG